jgi:glycosyltransferase involved in cell wall biosynthesis
VSDLQRGRPDPHAVRNGTSGPATGGADAAGEHGVVGADSATAPDTGADSIARTTDAATRDGTATDAALTGQATLGADADTAARADGPRGRPLRLWFLITALSVGGAERTLVDLANNLDRDSYDVTVWTMFDRNPLATDLDPAIPVRTLGSAGRTRSERGDFVERPAPLDYLGIPVRFARAVRRERPDVIQSFLFYDNTLARLVGTLSPSTTVVTGVRGMQHIGSPVVRTVDRLTMGLSDRIVSNSAAGAAHVRRRGADPDRVAVVHNGRDLRGYADAEPASLREAFDVPTDAPLVGTVGRLVERKGGYDLLAAWPRVRQAVPDAHLVFVGDGVERDGLTDRARDLGIADSVHFAGTRDDVPAVLAALDCFVFPSHYEGLPGALLEAMAAGRPIVATDIEGSDELLVDGECGLLVPPHAPSGLADALVRVLTDRPLADRLGTAARERAFDRFSLPSMVDAFERFYGSL